TDVGSVFSESEGSASGPSDCVGSEPGAAGSGPQILEQASSLATCDRRMPIILLEVASITSIAPHSSLPLDTPDRPVDREEGCYSAHHRLTTKLLGLRRPRERAHRRQPRVGDRDSAKVLGSAWRGCLCPTAKHFRRRGGPPGTGRVPVGGRAGGRAARPPPGLVAGVTLIWRLSGGRWWRDLERSRLRAVVVAQRWRRGR